MGAYCVGKVPIFYLGSIMKIEAYCVDKVHNILIRRILIFRAYGVGKVHNMLRWWHYDNGSILCK